MDGYLRDSRHSWDLRDSIYSWDQRDSRYDTRYEPRYEGRYDPRYAGERGSTEWYGPEFGPDGRQSWSSYESGAPGGPGPGSLARLVPMHQMPYGAASRPSPLRMSHGPEAFNDEYEYSYQNWSQVDLREHHRPPVGQSGLRNETSADDDKRKPMPPKDPNLVTFAGPKDPLNPKNWSNRKKWITTIIVSSYAFISPVSSSIIAPALGQVAQDLDITSEVLLKLTLSIFVLAYAIGPLFLGPLSEVFGRMRVLQGSALFYLAFNIACGFAQTQWQLILFRFLAGLGGSAPLTIGGGVLGDCWPPAKRGKAVGIYQLAPLLGPAVGPIAGGFISENVTWRWVFWSTSMAAAAVQAVGLIFLKETYAPVLLKKKADRLRASTGNSELHTEFESDKTLPKVLRTATARPVRMLTTQPIIQVIALYMAYIFGLFYLLLSTFPGVYGGVYGESVGIAGLHYLSLGIGFAIGAQINAHLNFAIYRRLKAKNNGVGRPEFRIPQMYMASPLVPIGLFLYGWSVHFEWHWIVPDIGIALFGIGSVICLSCMQVYIIDSYTRFSASGIAAAIVLRSLAGCGFPLFAQSMYDGLGYGWGNSLLGFVAIGIGIPAPFFFAYYGERLRKRSTFAVG